MHSSSVPLSHRRKPSLPKHSHFLGSGAGLDLFPPIPSLHSLPRLGLCTAEAVRLGRAPVPLCFGGPGLSRELWVSTGAGLGGGWDRRCILWREHSLSTSSAVHVLSPCRPGSFSPAYHSLTRGAPCLFLPHVPHAVRNTRPAPAAFEVPKRLPFAAVHHLCPLDNEVYFERPLRKLTTS